MVWLCVCWPLETEIAWLEEPLVRLRKYLTAQKLWDDSKEEALLLDCRKEIDQEVDTYLNIKIAPVTDMIDYMYAKWPEALKEQRETLLQFGDSHHD